MPATTTARRPRQSPAPSISRRSDGSVESILFPPWKGRCLQVRVLRRHGPDSAAELQASIYSPAIDL